MPLSRVSETATRRDWLRGSGTLAGAVSGLGGCLGDGSETRETGWYTPDGDRFGITIIAPSNGTWPLNARTASQTLADFGIDATVELKEKAAYGSAVSQSDFDVAVQVWGAGGNNFHPYSFYSTLYSSSWCDVINVDPTAVTVPMPVGDPEGDMETVDVTKRLSRLANASTDRERRSQVQELAWIYNQHLPRLPLNIGIGRAWLRTDDWEVPPKQSQWMRRNGVFGVLRNGRIDSTGGGEDRTFTLATRNPNPNDMQWNPYFAQGGHTEPEYVIFERLVWDGVYPNDVDSTDLPEETPELAQEYDVTDGTISLTLHDDRVWTDGDPVTAADVATQFRLEQHLGQRTGELWDDIEVTGDYELAIDVGDRDPQLVRGGLLSSVIRTKRDSVFGEWLERFESAEDEDQREAISEEIVTTRVEERPSYGLWQIEDVSNRRVECTLHEEHPRASETNLESVIFRSISSNQTRWQAMQSDRVDGLRNAGAPPSIEKQFPEDARRLPYNNSLGDALLLNHGRPPFDDHRVRRALAFLINRHENTHNAKDIVTTIQYPVGLPNDQAEQYLADSLGEYDQYGYESSMPDTAATLLEAAGYTRS